jgi:transposase
MRGNENTQDPLFSYVSLEERVPADHPLRQIRRIADEALKEMDPVFQKVYSHTGRPSIPPEVLFRALLLQYLHGIRSEIQLMQQIDYNLLFRWFVGIGIDDSVWTPEVFCVNRERLFSSEMTGHFFSAVVKQARKRRLLSKDHFSVDGSLLKAWASQKSFQSKGKKRKTKSEQKDPGDFHGEKRSNATHESTTDPEARLYRKSSGSESMLCYMGHVLMENRNGLVVDREVTPSGGVQEREAALAMLERRSAPSQRVTVGGDKGYDVNDFLQGCRDLHATPHVAQRNDGRDSVLDGRTTRHVGYSISQTVRKRIEQIFGWVKSAAGLRQVKVRGITRIGAVFDLALCAYNLLRIRNLIYNST